jgi:hypothetical protein
MTTDRPMSLFALDAVLRASLRPGDTDPGLLRRVVRGTRRHLRHLERVRRDFVVDASERGITAIRPGARGEHPGAAATRHAEQGLEELREYVDGGRSFFTVALDLERLPEFQHRVLAAMRRAPSAPPSAATRSRSSFPATASCAATTRSAATPSGWG